MRVLAIGFAAVGIAFLVFRVWRLLRRKNVMLIVKGARARPRDPFVGTQHIFFSLVDHFEPYWHNTDDALATERVDRWCRLYPRMVDGLSDRGGRRPRHAFFYPQEEYRPEILDRLADLTRRELGDVEIHLHHDNDTSEGLAEKLTNFRDTLRNEHGLLHEEDGRTRYAFIHGNWALGNSMPDGSMCGVDDEIRVLRKTGCYADFTYPSSPHPTQPPTVNRIYYAAGDERRRCAHHTGIDVEFGRKGRDALMLFSGPLVLNWKRRRRGVFPAIENGDITGLNPAFSDRVDAWIRSAVHVRGWPRWIFVKAYTHGAQEGNSDLLLSDRVGGLRSLYGDLLHRYDDGSRYVLHLSTPWEMYRCARILESGDAAAIEAVEQFA